jgi:hypothetical protein
VPRPKSDDPRELVSFRIRRSAKQWWSAQSEKNGKPSVEAHLQWVLEEKAERELKSNLDVLTRFKKGDE